ncbi:hypothetical protein D9M72_527250 [compost metagenome]
MAMAQPCASVRGVAPAIASYSVPIAYWCEGAQLSATPWVPGAQAMIGRWPANHGVHGTSTVPVTAMALPSTSVDLYMICQPETSGNPIGTNERERIKVPCGPSGSVWGGV